jgi:hypothetical protein
MAKTITLTVEEIDRRLEIIRLKRENLKLEDAELDADAIAYVRMKKILLNGDQPGAHLMAPPTDIVIEDGLGFNEAVRRVARNFREEDFTVPKIEARLTELGVTLPEIPRQRIAMELKKMCDSGVIKKIEVGTGNTPHVYKVA